MIFTRFGARVLAIPVIAVGLGPWTPHSQLHAQVAPLDSTRLVALYQESANAANAIPTTDSTRLHLVRRIARAQVSVGDIPGALLTARPLGPWRREVQTDAACRLLEDRRFDDAHRLVRQLPAGDREWALAHLASAFARPPWSPRRQQRDTVDTAPLAQRALSVASEVREPRARVDAFLAIARALQYRNRDMVRAATVLDSALTALARVRDADFASNRRGMIANGFGAQGRTNAALALLPLLALRDRVDVAWRLADWRDARDPRVRAELLGLVAQVAETRDARVRAAQATGIVHAFNSLGDTALADSVAARLGADPSSGRQPRPIVADPSIVERAELVAKSNVSLAIQLIDSLDDPLGAGRRARALVKVALAVPPAKVDTVALLLRRARQAAFDVPLSVRQRSLTLREVAEAQLGRALFDDAVSSYDAITDRAVALETVRALGGMAFWRLSIRDRRSFVARLANEEIRVATTGAIIEHLFLDSKITDADLAWASSLADSLPSSASREKAQVAIAQYSFFRNDTAGARARLLRLLAARDRESTRWASYQFMDALIFWLLRVGALDETLVWARALPAPASRAAALLEIGGAAQWMAKLGEPMWISNGPDMCREEF